MQNKITSVAAASDTEEMQFIETQYHNAAAFFLRFC